MFERMTSRRYRPWWIAAGLILVLLIAFSVPQVRVIANSFLGIFRVQQIAVVPVDNSNLPQQIGSSSELESLMSKDVQYQKTGEMHKVSSAAEASNQAGITVRLPAQASGEPLLYVTPSGSATMVVDQKQVQALLNEIGRSDIKIPAGVDGSKIILQIPNAVTAQYGECQNDRPYSHDPDQGEIPTFGNCTTLIQLTSPTIQTPPGIDIEQIGVAYLQVLGMSRQEAESFAANIDWASTFVLPIPRSDADFTPVQVDGVNGTLIQQKGGRANEYMLLWVKDGILYALTGPGSSADALALGNSLK